MKRVAVVFAGLAWLAGSASGIAWQVAPAPAVPQAQDTGTPELLLFNQAKRLFDAFAVRPGRSDV